MSEPKPTTSFAPAVVAAIETIVNELALGVAGRRRLERFLETAAAVFEKLPHVSFFAATTRRGGVNYRIQYKLAGHKRRTERLGRNGPRAYKRGQRVSDVLQQVAARTMKPEEAYRELYVGGTFIVVQVEAFARHLKDKGNTARHIEITMTRLRRGVELAGVDRLSDLSRTTYARLTGRLRDFVDPKSRKQLSTGTINDYLAVFRQFSAWAKATGLTAEDQIEKAAGVRQTDKKKRRDLLPEEIAQMVQIAASGAVRADMPAEERSMMYLTAFATGFRRRELRAIERAWIRLDADVPYIWLPPEWTKDRKGAKQVLPSWFAVELAGWMGDRRTGKLLPSMPLNVARMFDRDRAAARQAWVNAAPDAGERAHREADDFLKRQTHDGEIVFHCMRHSFSTAAAANLDLKTAQLLTRHATESVLANVYAHSRFEKAAAGVEKAILDPRKALAKGAANIDAE